MISIFERFYDPSSGAIIIDDSDELRSLNPHLYRDKVALVPQEPALFPGSIRENIALGLGHLRSGSDRPELDDACLERTLRAANAWEFVSSLPDGSATLCGHNGDQLSGGQRQRIAIARALVRNPKVLLLDEATSARDTAAEEAVHAALIEPPEARTRITIAVAHRLSTIRHANRIFVLSQGHIAEAGSHDELTAKGGICKKMCDAQSLDSVP